MTLTSSAVLKAKAFKSGYNASSEATASFSQATTGTISSGLVAYWKFDEGTGTTAADSSGNGNTGTLANGPVWTSGIAGNALYFDGIDDSVTILDSNTLNPSSSFTVSAWVNPATTFTDFRSILVKNYRYYLYSSVAGYCGDGIPLGGFSEVTNNTVCQPAPLAANTWTHLSLTYDSSTLMLYRNGVAVATAAASETPSPTTGNLQIGASQYGEYFQGLIDEVRIYNRALTNIEIQTIYQQAAVTLPFDYAISNSGDRSVNAGSSVTDTISATLVSGASQTVSYSVSGLPSGATGTFSSASCTPACSTVLTISTSGSTPAGNFPITITATGGGVQRSTVFTLSVTFALTVGTPTLTPNGGGFSSSVSVTVQSATAGSSIYYTTDGSTPTQSSTPYVGAMTLTSSATVNAKAFKSGYTPSAVASASFTSLAGGSGGSSPASYYVGKNGSDSYSCSQARNSGTPKLTIVAGLSCVSNVVGAGANQIVEVAAGTYNEQLNMAVNISGFPSGTSWAAPFTLRAHAGDTVTIKTPTGSANLQLFRSAPFYAIIDGFTYDGTNLSGFTANIVVESSTEDGNSIQISNSNLINNHAGGLLGSSRTGAAGTDLRFINNKVHGGPFDCGGSLGGDFCYPIYYGGANSIFEGNELYHFPSYGFHIYNHGTPQNNIVRNNLIHDFADSCGGSCTAGFDTRGNGIILDGTGNQAYNNVIYNGARGISINGGGNNIQILNNTIYNASIVGITYNSTVNAVVKNNINYNPSASNGDWIHSGDSGTVISNNLCTTSAAGCSVVGNPLFVDAASGNFTLQAGSSAIAAGIGAYQ